MGIIYSKCYNGVIMVPGFADGSSESSKLPVTQSSGTLGHVISHLISHNCDITCDIELHHVI